MVVALKGCVLAIEAEISFGIVAAMGEHLKVLKMRFVLRRECEGCGYSDR
jgi:hypothetical protein